MTLTLTLLACYALCGYLCARRMLRKALSKTGYDAWEGADEKLLLVLGALGVFLGWVVYLPISLLINSDAMKTVNEREADMKLREAEAKRKLAEAERIIQEFDAIHGKGN